MQREGVMTQFTTIAGETRTNVVLATGDHSQHIKMNDAGPTVTEAEVETLLKQVAATVKPGDWWVLAGSLPKGVATDCYARLIKIIHAAGGFTLLDSSGEAFKLACAARPTVVKPNLEEAHELLNDTSLTPEQCVKQITELGPRQVVISLGKDGVAFLEDNQDGDCAKIGILQSPSIIEKNPTGAGDSLVGGLVYELNRGNGVATAARFGAGCGAATASLAGTELGTLEMVQALLD